MATYLVRLKDTAETVGLFSAEDEDELSILIDELTDPSDCEYAEMPSGGITWPRHGVPFPIAGMNWEEEGRDPLSVIGTFSVTERWFFDLTGADLEFGPLFASGSAANEP